MGKQIFFLVLGAMMLGWIVPNFMAPGLERSDPRPDPVKREYVGGAGDWGRGTVSGPGRLSVSDHVLSRSSDGHFYAVATVDSRDYRVMVDTGASIVALTGSDARDMGIYWDESEIRPIGRGASGDVLGTPTVIDRMTIGDLEARNIQAVIIPEGLDVSLLGQSFLQQVGGMRVEADQMTLGS
ncbi:retropepsin-like aspartic protease family protein [Altererythrobacter aquiaggeris]|uniref:retropepsin-like aspartic protease family protein n=1 Tax=Aestuarierythrobacter aquiaggeris TaxID=1898396 RepID=UPI00301A1D57